MKRLLPLFLVLSFCLSCVREPATIAVSGIAVYPDRLTLTVGESATLSATVSPADATDKTVLWSSSDATVATVSDGAVSALKAGSASIFVTTKDGGFKTACTVTVEDELVMDPGQDLAPVFDEKGGTLTLSFKAARPWTATIPGDRIDWVKLEPAQGNAGAGNLRLTVAENTAFDARSASVRIQCGDSFETIVVFQKQNDDLTVTASSFEIGAEGGLVSIEVKANVDYTYNIDGEWISAVGTRTYEARTLTFQVAQNETLSKREGAVTFKGGGFSETVRIFQEGETPTIVLSQNEYEFESTGGTFQITVRSNVDVAVEIPAEVSWIKEITTRTFSSNQFNFEVSPNPEYEGRTVQICFTNRDNGLAETVTVNQKQKDALILSDNEVIVPEQGGEFDVKLSSNVDISFKIDADWIHEQPRTRGITESTYLFTADPLPTGKYLRQGTIVFSGAGLTGTVVVKQKDSSPIIQFKDQEVKRLCIREWDRNGDGDFSEREAASVTSIAGVFEGNQSLVSFEELRFFTGLKVLATYSFAMTTNLRSIVLPEGLTEIGSFVFQDSGLEGKLILPASLKVLGERCFWDCKNLRTVVLPDGLTTLGEGAFEGSGLEGDLVIPAGITVIPNGCFSCEDLNKIILPQGLTDIEEAAFGSCYNLSNVEILAERIPTCGNNAFPENGDYLIFVPSGRATDYQIATGWRIFAKRITEKGHQPSEFFYASTDYSHDGEVLCLQKATRGRGINLIFLGDGFVDFDMEPDGYYETVMRQWMEQFFILEPYRSFRDWFNVYTVKVVCKNGLFGSPDSERRLTRDLRDDESRDKDHHSIATLDNICDDYASLVPNPHGQALKICVFTPNIDTQNRSFCVMLSNGYCLSFVFKSYDTYENARRTLNHELGGHGFGWLGDEYIDYYSAQDKPQETLEWYQSWYKWGAKKNLDWRSDPETVGWSHFLKDPRYANEGLGVFEGGNLYAYGVFRPTRYGLMGVGPGTNHVFNAPSRESIYKQIMYWGVGEDWEYDYEEFVKADEAGRKQAAEAYAAYPKTSSYVLRNDFEPGLPPIILDSPVKEIRVSKNGKVSLIH